MTEQVELKQAITDVADVLRKNAVFNKEKGIVEFSKDAFAETLPEGLDVKLVRKVDVAKQNFALAQSLVTGELAVKAFKEDKALEKVTSSIPLPVGKAVSIVSREFVSRNPTTGEESKSYAYTQARIVTKVPGSQNQAIRSRVAALAEKAKLGK